MSSQMIVDGYTITHIMAALEENVEKYGNKEAVVCDDGVITYRDISRVSDNIAVHLKKEGVDTGDIVAIVMGRGSLVFGAIAAIWKLRAAFVYIDECSPDQALHSIAEDCMCSHIFYETQFARWAQQDVISKAAPLWGGWDFEDPAWVVMTSGTTGHSKAVKILHRNVACFDVLSQMVGVTQNDRMSMLASFSFMSVMAESVPAFYRGATVVMVPRSIRGDLKAIGRFLEQEHIAISFLPAHFAEHFVAEDMHAPHLRILMTGGESVHRLKKCSYTILCGYGATETCGPAMMMNIDYRSECYPLGQVTPGRKLYLLDDDLTPVTEPGSTGELCFAGEAICDGYLNDKASQNRHFIDNPFAQDDRHRVLFRTGDIARLEEDGSIVFMHRSDLMCKVRSFRIEISEVESALKSFTGVERCVVMPLQDSAGNKALHAFYYSRKRLDAKAIHDYLCAQLLHYKVPEYYHQLDTLPLADNGKVERSAIGIPRGFSHPDEESCFSCAAAKAEQSIGFSVVSLVRLRNPSWCSHWHMRLRGSRDRDG